MTKRAVPEREGERIRLRLLEERDLSLTLGWRNRDDIRRWFFHSDLITPEQHRLWYKLYRDRDDDFVFVIEEVRELRRPVGQVSLYHLDREARRAEYGRLIVGEVEAVGRGLAREATTVLLELAFGFFGIDEVYLKVYACNNRAVAVYHACGFVVAEQRDDVLLMTKSNGATR